MKKRFRVRCSAASDIMTNPKGGSFKDKLKAKELAIKETNAKYQNLKTKDGKMGLGYLKKVETLSKEVEILKPRQNEIVISDTCRTHLRKWYNSKKYNRRKDIQVKYTKKGIIGEEVSTTLVNRMYARDYGYRELQTSKDREIKRITDDYKTGECDIWIEKEKHVRDVKTSWDLDSFPGGPLAKDELDPKYDKQIKCYADLWGAEMCFVDYCLIDTPTRLIVDELRKLDYKYGIFGLDDSIVRDESIPLVVEKVSNMIYTREGLQNFIDDPINSHNIEIEWFEDFIEIPEDERVKTYEVNPAPIFIVLWSSPSDLVLCISVTGFFHIVVLA